MLNSPHSSPVKSHSEVILGLIFVVLASLGISGCEAAPGDDPNSKQVPDSKEALEDKYNSIQMGMTEAQVDQLLAGHPRGTEPFTPFEKKAYGPPYGDGKNNPILSQDI